jgi:FkbM family methyltransferase
MTTSAGNPYRRRTMLEQLAQRIPRVRGFERVRRRLRSSYERMLGWRSGGLRSVLPGGETVLVAPEWRYLTWNPREYSAFRAATQPGDIVLDIGANAGCYAILFGQWVGASGRVYAFEPDPRAFEGLTRHIRLNALDDRVIPIPAAVAGHEHPAAPFAMADAHGVSHLAAGTTHDAIQVRTTSIDQFCNQHRITPDVIKIDVEGAELAVLRGARDTIAAAGAELRLFVELHASLWRHSGITEHDIHRECEALGMTIEQLDGRRDGLWTTEGVCLRLRPERA